MARKPLKKGENPFGPQVDSGEATRLFLEKLESSGLSKTDALALGMRPFTPAESAEAGYALAAALYIPYFDPWSPAPVLMKFKHDWPTFHRIRYLTPVLDKDGDPIKYMQPADSGVCAYFPTIIKDWAKILGDYKQPLIITEGELKAAKTSQMGFPTIGLGGVHNFRSAKNGVFFLRELEKITWARRKVYIIHDSDYRTNGNICHAINALADELDERGALVFTVGLPDVVEGGKTGLDDYFVNSETADLASVLRTRSEMLGLSRPLWQLNDEVAYIQNPGFVVRLKDGLKISVDKFKYEMYANREYYSQVLTKDGEIIPKKVKLAPDWMGWPHRHELGSMSYAPGKPQIYLNGSVATSYYNSWKGWGCAPKEGDVTPFLQLLDHIFEGAEPAAKEWFLRWLAFPIKYPGAKLFSAAVIYGVFHGTGKSLIGYTMEKVYGENFQEIKQADLHGAFNEWAIGKQFVMGDDVTGSDRDADADVLKKLITQKTMRINGKFLPTYNLPDCINYLFTSNRPNAMFLEDTDRRFFVHEVIAKPKDEEFYMDYGLWLDTEGGPAIFHYLQHLDLGNFNPSAPALRTSAKDRMTDDARSDIGDWVRKLKHHPETVLLPGMAGDLFTNSQLLAIYDPDRRTRVTANGLGRELKKAQLRQVNDGRSITGVDGCPPDRYYAIRNVEHWERARLDELQAHLASKGANKKPKY